MVYVNTVQEEEQTVIIYENNIYHLLKLKEHQNIIEQWEKELQQKQISDAIDALKRNTICNKVQ
jgi:hypothetical protein